MERWREIQRESFSSLEKLADFLELSSEKRQFLFTLKRFPLLLPRRLAAKIKKNSLTDPLARQFLPVIHERETSPRFTKDPLQEALKRPLSRLLHKYEGRVLFISAAACAMHCRYCFRRNFSYPTQNDSYEKELDYIRQETSLHEVILSGGDPLSVSDDVLQEILSSLEKISHIKVIRLHTRFIMGIPERITPRLLTILSSCKKQIAMVIHANHPNEFDEEIFDAYRKLKKAGILLLCQSVLLKGVNDDLATLRELSLLLIENGIIPYYLHQLDLVEGAVHFEVEEKRGEELMDELRKHIPGWALFRYVKEEAGKLSKTPLNSIF